MRRLTTRSLFAIVMTLGLVLSACAPDEEGAAEPEPEAGAEEAEEAEEEPEATEPEAEAVDFPTRDITFITRGSPGGGHDTFTRAFAPMLEEELGTTVVVENMTGGAGLVAEDHMRQIEPDGYTIHIMDPVGLLGFHVADDPDFDFDSDFDFEFLGTVTQRPTTYAVAANSDIEDWDGFVEALETGELRWAHTGLGSTHAFNNIIVLDELGAPEPVFVPHEGSAEVFTALARGDGDFTVLAVDSVADAAAEGDVRPILHFASEPMEDLVPGVPTGADVGLEQFDGVLVSSLAIVAPPETDPAVVEILRDAVETVAFSDEFAQWGQENDRIVAPLTAEETDTQLRSVVDLYSSNRDILEPLLE